MKLPFSQIFKTQVAIDVGSSNVRIWTDELGLTINEPSCVAIDQKLKRVIAVGQEAQDMLGRISNNVKVAYPIVKGMIHDEDLAIAMLKVLFQRVFPKTVFWRPVMAASISNECGLAERQAMERVLKAVGAREVFLVDQCLAAAIGSGVPIADVSGSFVLNMGGGVTEAGVIALGSVVASLSLPQAGQYLDEQIVALLKTQKGIAIGTQAANRIKTEIGQIAGTQAAEMLVSGQDVKQGVPKEVYVDSSLISPVITQLMDKYVELMKAIFTKIPTELTTDVIDKGILCTGGLAKLKGIEPFFTAKLGVPIFVVENPGEVVIKGLAQILEHLDLFVDSLGYQG